LQRWIIWAATAIATLWAEPRDGRTIRWRITILLTLGAIAVLGALATVDVIDVWNVLPWMGDDPWWREIGLGAVVAVVVPFIAGIFWLRMFRVAVIAGIGLAFLLHVTLAVVLVSSIYMLADMLFERSVSAKRLALALGGVVIAGVLPVVFGLIAVAAGD
jgi:hypothetical protein